MANRTFLHVGTPKSGTSYLQAVLWQNVEPLRHHGLLLPARFQAHYAAAKGVTSTSSLMRETKVDADIAWPRLTRLVNEWQQDAVISHELLAPATREQADRAKAALVDTEIHVILTARALHKQLSSSWQQQVKGGLRTPYDVFVERVRRPPRWRTANRQAKGAWFWSVQDLVAIAQRWGGGVPAHRLHVVTVPPESSGASVLWQRYASVLGVDPDSYDSAVPNRNVSLGAVEVELLRRVHAAADPRFKDRAGHRWTRKLFVTEILGQRRGTPIRTPDASAGWLSERTAHMVSELNAAGYHVVGDLDDLLWQPSSSESRLVSSVTDAEVADAADWAIARLQEHLVRRRPDSPPPAVGPGDGVAGVLELLEHIRAADTDATPRPAPSPFRRSLAPGRRAIATMRSKQRPRP